jgi:predicted enzyme related to lactoylglutathione lyase
MTATHPPEEDTVLPNPVVHFEIGCRDSDKTQEFFSKLFGWTMKSMGPAAMISTGSDEGIVGHITALGHEPHHYVTIYVQVDDIEAHLAKAGKLGGKTLVPATEVPGMGHFAWFADPDGNHIGLWKPMQRGG